MDDNDDDRRDDDKRRRRLWDPDRGPIGDRPYPISDRPFGRQDDVP